MTQTYKQRFNKKYGNSLNKPNSLKEIAKKTGNSEANLKKILKKGEGAFRSNPQSVRPQVKSAVQWGYARVYSAVMGGPAAKIDKNFLKKKTLKKA